jgi:drug/metabolite transporter (DMT)-like permease
MSAAVDVRPSPTRIVAAFAALYLIWGSTYLAIAYAVTSMPPFLMGGARFLIAGGLMYAWLRLRGEAAPRPEHWRSGAIVGTLLLLGGNGLVCWAERSVASSVTALLLASTPLWMSVLPWLARKGPAPGAMAWTGIVIGLAGVALLVDLSPAAIRSGHAAATAAVLLASVSWSIGSLWSKSLPAPAPLMAAATQMLCGGAGLIVLGLICGEMSQLDPAAISTVSWISFAFLVSFGSIVGFGSFVFLLRWVAPTRVATYAYVNPVVAVLLGWAVAGEAIGTRTCIGAALVISAVGAIVSATGRRSPRITAHETPVPAGALPHR